MHMHALHVTGCTPRDLSVEFHTCTGMMAGQPYRVMTMVIIVIIVYQSMIMYAFNYSTLKELPAKPSIDQDA